MIDHLDGAVIPTGFDVPVEPLRRSAHFTGEPGCIAEARAFASLFLEQLRNEWCATIGKRTDGAALLVVSELVTNADRHSNGPYILELEGTDEAITVAVYDSSGTLPRMFPAIPSASAATAWRSCRLWRATSSWNAYRSESVSARC
ncbi:hypothetical protein SHIRM173S_05280 [Streptomyces hirsutus]